MRRFRVWLFLIILLHIILLAAPVYAEEKQSVYSGSGFFITPQVVVTSNHVIKGASKIEIIYDNAVRLNAAVIGGDEDSDVALLRVEGIEQVVCPLALAPSDTVRQGSRVYAVGFPLPQVMGMQAKLSEGLISSLTGLRDDAKMYQISTPVQPGNSGGPLLNERAEVIGVVAGGLDAAKMLKEGFIPQNVNYAVKSDSIYELVYKYRLAGCLSISWHTNSLTAADVMDIARQAVIFIVVVK